MDETRELTAEQQERPLASCAQDDLRKGLEAVACVVEECVVSSSASTDGADFTSGAEASLEALIEAFGFERGFFLAQRSSSSTTTEEIVGATDLEAVASRASCPEGETPRWKEVTNPDYALDRAAVTEALKSGEVVAIDGSLSRTDSRDGEWNRPVLCRACRLTSRLRGVVYLEGRLGQEDIAERHRDSFAWLVDRLAPVWGRAFLEARLTASTSAVQPATPRVDDEDGKDSECAAELPDGESPVYHGIIGNDKKLRKVFEIIEKVKDSNLNVCIFGESGTGKELVARAIHYASNRAEQEFVSENCGAISESLLESELFGHMRGSFTGAEEDRKGLFELAHKGTLFLDEIGDMSESMQRKLLRALQEGVIRPIGSKESIQVDVRVLCASNRDLEHLVQRNEFRADLYYRLNVITIHVPPLRERRDDVPFLIRDFTRDVEETDGVRKRFSESALKALVQYGWPGNVRELRNVVRRSLLTSTRKVIARKDVMPFLAGGIQSTACLGENLERDDDRLILRIPMRQTFNEIIDECESLVLTNALKENGWNKSRVTKALGIPRQSLYNKIAKYRLKKPAPGES
jgi:transcriptional regulator with GAF, ATPase, and Fis domain